MRVRPRGLWLKPLAKRLEIIGGCLPPVVHLMLTPIAVGLTVYGLTAFDKLNNVPANVFGYAATFGFLLMGTGFNDALDMEGANLIALDLANPIIVTSLSFVLGSVFGLISEKVAGMLK